MPQLEKEFLPKNVFMINYFGRGVLLQRNEDKSITMFKPKPTTTEGTLTKEDATSMVDAEVLVDGKPVGKATSIKRKKPK